MLAVRQDAVSACRIAPACRIALGNLNLLFVLGHS